MGSRLASIIAEVGMAMRPGDTTAAIEERVLSGLAAEGWSAAMKGFSGFPAACAISVNEEVLHGLPGDRALASGDLVTIQVTARGTRAYAAVGWTFGVGEVDDASRRLLAVGMEGLDRAIALARPGVRTGTLGAAIQECIEASGFSVVRDYVGYSMGQSQFEGPHLPCYGREGTGPRLPEDIIVNLHVIAKQAGFKVDILPDEWTVAGAPGERSVLFTAMVLLEGSAGIVLTPMPRLRGETA
jgi:methionyl aminopeptidase